MNTCVQGGGWVSVCISTDCSWNMTSGKSFLSAFASLNFQSIIFRYQIHPNRCSVLNDMGSWQPATDAGDEREARDQVQERWLHLYAHKHTHMPAYLTHFTGALCRSYHPHHLQLWGKWERHAVTVIWWKFSEFSVYGGDVTQGFGDTLHCKIQFALLLGGKLLSERSSNIIFLPYPEACDR